MIFTLFNVMAINDDSSFDYQLKPQGFFPQYSVLLHPESLIHCYKLTRSVASKDTPTPLAAAVSNLSCICFPPLWVFSILILADRSTELYLFLRVKCLYTMRYKILLIRIQQRGGTFLKRLQCCISGILQNNYCLNTANQDEGKRVSFSRDCGVASVGEVAR